MTALDQATVARIIGETRDSNDLSGETLREWLTAGGGENATDRILADAARRVMDAVAAQDWRPIETQPSTGRWLIVGADGEVDLAWGPVQGATRWMPLPPPPDAAQDREEWS